MVDAVTTKNPPIDVPAIDPKTGCWVPVQFDRQKRLDGLQPLSDIPAVVPPTPLTPGNTTASVTSRSVSLTQSGTGSMTNVLGWNSPNNQSLYDSFTTLQGIIGTLSANDANLAAAISALNTRVTALENKVNAVIAALA